MSYLRFATKARPLVTPDEGPPPWWFVSGQGRISGVHRNGTRAILFDPPVFPQEGRWDITPVGSTLWVLSGWLTTPQGFYLMSTAGASLGFVPAPVSNLIAVGVARDGAHIWGVTETTVYKLTTSGSVVDSFSAPGPEARGICADPDGAHLWITDTDTHIVYQITTSGSVVRSWPFTPGRRFETLAFDPTNDTLLIHGSGPVELYRLDRNGNLLEVLDPNATSPGGGGFAHVPAFGAAE